MRRKAQMVFASKIARALVTPVLMVTSVFVLMRCEGDPVTVLLGPDATADMRAAYSGELGLDRPILVQYLAYLHNVVRGSLGVSYVYRQGCTWCRPQPPSVDANAHLLCSYLGGGRGHCARNSCHGVSIELHRPCVHDREPRGIVRSQFLPAIVLMLVFSIQLNWLPTGGADSWRGLALPAVTMEAASSAVLARYTRVAVRESLDSRYVLAAFMRGIPFSRIVIHHVLPNAAVPILTILGLLIGGAVTGSTVVETVFSWPGYRKSLRYIPRKQRYSSGTGNCPACWHCDDHDQPGRRSRLHLARSAVELLGDIDEYRLGT